MKDQRWFLTIILSIVFGLMAGIFGELIIRFYVLKDTYNLASNSEINLSSQNLNQSNLVIRDAKNVVVSQDIKINETIIGAANSLLAIFKKSSSGSYDLNKSLAEGLVLTSDGWLMLASWPDSLDYKNYADYLALDQNYKAYKIDQAVLDKKNNLLFLHLNGVNNLAVKNIANLSQLNAGQIFVAADFNKRGLVSYLIERTRKNNGLLFSDQSENFLVLDKNLSIVKSINFVFNLNGDVVGLLKNGEVRPLSDFSAGIYSLFKKQTLSYPALGAYYVNRDTIARPDAKIEYGALITGDKTHPALVKGGAAELSGLKAGDVIMTLDNIDLNDSANLADILTRYSAGDTLNLKVLRADKIIDIPVKLSELK